MGAILEKIKAKIANFHLLNILTSVKYFIQKIVALKIFKKLVFYIVLVIVIITGTFIAIRKIRNIPSKTVPQVQVAGPKATISLNKEFDFPLTDSKAAQVGNFKYIIDSVDLRDEIVVKGQKATAIEGKTFLVINLKIVNEFNQGVQINTKDYIRLSVNGNTSEWLAPDIHNDPVEVQAISTKLTRVGFAISNSDKDLILRIGEISGTKTDLPVKFN